MSWFEVFKPKAKKVPDQVLEGEAESSSEIRDYLNSKREAQASLAVDDNAKKPHPLDMVSRTKDVAPHDKPTEDIVTASEILRDVEAPDVEAAVENTPFDMTGAIPSEESNFNRKKTDPLLKENKAREMTEKQLETYNRNLEAQNFDSIGDAKEVFGAKNVKMEVAPEDLRVEIEQQYSGDEGFVPEMIKAGKEAAKTEEEKAVDQAREQSNEAYKHLVVSRRRRAEIEVTDSLGWNKLQSSLKIKKGKSFDLQKAEEAYEQDKAVYLAKRSLELQAVALVDAKIDDERADKDEDLKSLARQEMLNEAHAYMKVRDRIRAEKLDKLALLDRICERLSQVKVGRAAVLAAMIGLSALAYNFDWDKKQHKKQVVAASKGPEIPTLASHEEEIMMASTHSGSTVKEASPDKDSEEKQETTKEEFAKGIKPFIFKDWKKFGSKVGTVEGPIRHEFIRSGMGEEEAGKLAHDMRKVYARENKLTLKKLDNVAVDGKMLVDFDNRRIIAVDGILDMEKEEQQISDVQAKIKEGSAQPGDDGAGEAKSESGQDDDNVQKDLQETRKRIQKDGKKTELDEVEKKTQESFRKASEQVQGLRGFYGADYEFVLKSVERAKMNDLTFNEYRGELAALRQDLAGVTGPYLFGDWSELGKMTFKELRETLKDSPELRKELSDIILKQSFGNFDLEPKDDQTLAAWSALAVGKRFQMQLP